MLSNIKFIRNLSGHSGCILSLFKDNINNNTFVRKTSGSKEYNKRLMLQYLKQKNIIPNEFYIPKILNSGINTKGMFYFDMEFINSKSLSASISTMQIRDIINFVGKLFKILPINESKYTKKCKNAVNNKIIELKKINLLTPEIQNSIKLISDYDFSNIPESTCH